MTTCRAKNSYGPMVNKASLLLVRRKKRERVFYFSFLGKGHLHPCMPVSETLWPPDHLRLWSRMFSFTFFSVDNVMNLVLLSSLGVLCVPPRQLTNLLRQPVIQIPSTCSNTLEIVIRVTISCVQQLAFLIQEKLASVTAQG